MKRITGTLSLNAQERRDLEQLITTLRDHLPASQISFGVLLGDDDVWTVGQEIRKWAERLDIPRASCPDCGGEVTETGACAVSCSA